MQAVFCWTLRQEIVLLAVLPSIDLDHSPPEPPRTPLKPLCGASITQKGLIPCCGLLSGLYIRTTPSRAPARNRSRQSTMGFCARRGCEGAVAGGGVERRARSSGARGRGPAAGSGLGPSG